MVLPLLKLGTLALKTLSKPIAARLKKEAGLHPKFRNLIISIAQLFTSQEIVASGRTQNVEELRNFAIKMANHRMTTTMQRRIYGHATDVGIRPLNEEKAVQAAVDLLGEFFVFSTSFDKQSNDTNFKHVKLYMFSLVIPKRNKEHVMFSHSNKVAVAALVFEVQRSSRAEAKKEGLRRQEMEKLRQRDEALEKDMEDLKSKIQELEQLARGKGLAGLFNFRLPHIEEGKSATPA